MARRTSIIWKIPKEELASIVAKYNSYKDILATFGLENKGNNFKTLRNRMIEDKIDYSHLLKIGQNLSIRNAQLIPLDKILVENSNYNRGCLKRRLLKDGSLKCQCYSCGISNEWNGEALTLQLDHINGISNDNRLENLQMLCPNCHSQTSTFAGRKLRRQIARQNRLSRDENGNKIKLNRASKPRPNSRKVIRPSKEELAKLVFEIPTTKLAKHFGVSDKAIFKWCKSYGIDKPPRGYWQKKK